MRADLASGRVDARVVSLLDALTKQWTIGVSVIKTGHPLGPRSPGGRENDHYFFRAFDIVAVDGVPLSNQPAAAGAVALGNYLIGLVGDVRPSRVMGPAHWLEALDFGDRTGFRTDEFALAIHHDHLHIGY